MNVISRAGLGDLIAEHPEAKGELLAWYRVARAAEWKSLMDVRVHFPSADLAGVILIFDILHNRLRLITVVSWRAQRVYLKALLTHKEYDRKGCLRWA